jgi:1-acyl-sn-glycerol-3-phosphate acyltransferase
VVDDWVIRVGRLVFRLLGLRVRLEGLEHVPGAARTVRVRSNGVGSVTVRATAGTPAHA